MCQAFSCGFLATKFIRDIDRYQCSETKQIELPLTSCDSNFYGAEEELRYGKNKEHGTTYKRNYPRKILSPKLLQISVPQIWNSIGGLQVTQLESNVQHISCSSFPCRSTETHAVTRVPVPLSPVCLISHRINFWKLGLDCWQSTKSTAPLPSSEPMSLSTLLRPWPKGGQVSLSTRLRTTDAAGKLTPDRFGPVLWLVPDRICRNHEAAREMMWLFCRHCDPKYISPTTSKTNNGNRDAGQGRESHATQPQSSEPLFVLCSWRGNFVSKMVSACSRRVNDKFRVLPHPSVTSTTDTPYTCPFHTTGHLPRQICETTLWIISYGCETEATCDGSPWSPCCLGSARRASVDPDSCGESADRLSRTSLH